MAPSLLLFTLPQQLGRGALPTQSIMIINLMVAYPRKTIVWAASPAGAVGGATGLSRILQGN